MEHTNWIAEIAGGDSGNEVARKSGVPGRTIAHQIKTGRVSAENVIAIAIGYGRHPVGALVATGYLDEQYAREIDPATALREVSEEDLADEVLRRMKLGLGAGVFDVPIDELPGRHLASVADSSPDEDAHEDYDESSWDA